MRSTNARAHSSTHTPVTSLQACTHSLHARRRRAQNISPVPHPVHTRFDAQNSELKKILMEHRLEREHEREHLSHELRKARILCRYAEKREGGATHPSPCSPSRASRSSPPISAACTGCANSVNRKHPPRSIVGLVQRMPSRISTSCARRRRSWRTSSHARVQRPRRSVRRRGTRIVWRRRRSSRSTRSSGGVLLRAPHQRWRNYEVSACWAGRIRHSALRMPNGPARRPPGARGRTACCCAAIHILAFIRLNAAAEAEAAFRLQQVDMEKVCAPSLPHSTAVPTRFACERRVPTHF